MNITKNLLPIIRKYTGLDPYYHKVDNRPLKDLETSTVVLAGAVDAVTDSSRSVAAALGFVARGYAMRAGIETEVAVGSPALSEMNFITQHAFLIQQKAVQTGDTRLIPKIGIQVSSIAHAVSAAASGGNYKLSTLDARIVPADGAIPFYNEDNTDYPSEDLFEVGNIEWSVVDHGDYSLANLAQSPAAAASGWTRCCVFRVPYGTTEIDTDMVTYAGFKEDGAVFGFGGGGSNYELNIDYRIVGTSGGVSVGSTYTDFSSITIDTQYAMVFVQGIFQFGYQILNSSTIRIPKVLPNGTHVAFVSTAGGQYTGGQYLEQRVQGVTGQSTFSNLQVNAYFSSVYITGAYQGKHTYTVVSESEISLNQALEADADVFFVEIRSGIADSAQNVPAGGTTGQVLKKLSDDDFNFDWEDEAAVDILPEADPVTDLGKVLVYVGDVDDAPVYEWQAQLPVVPAPLTETQKEAAILALVNSQKACNRPPIVVHNKAIIDSGHYVIGHYLGAQVYASTDFGRTWGLLAEGVTLPNGIGGLAYRVSTDTLIAVGGGKICRSTNQGATWTVVFTPANPDVFFNHVVVNQETGQFAAVGTAGTVAYSTNDGVTWAEYSLNLDLDLTDITVVADGSTGKWVAVGVDGDDVVTTHLYYTGAAPSSEAWTGITDAAIDITGGFVKCISDGAVYIAVAASGEVARSVSPGVSWANVHSMPTGITGKGIGYFDDVFVAFGTNNNASISIDEGVTWDDYVVGNGDSSEIYTTMIADGTSGFILGSYDTARAFSKIRRS
jgi:photosystem II stability/assembly factor-like uncharacterized protein